MKNWFLIFAVCSLSFAGCKRHAATPPPPVRPVAVAQAATRDVPIYLDEIGTCVPFQSVTVQPQVSGPIAEIHFTDGAEVKKGDLLFTIDQRPFQAALDKAKATLASDQAKATYNDKQLVRSKELVQTKAIAAQDVDAAASNAVASDAGTQASEAGVEGAQIALDYCTIRSPIDGRAGKRLVDVGNVVSPITHLLLIQRQDPVYVEFTISESALPRVRKFIADGKLKIQASFADDATKSRVGDFDFLDSGVQPGAGTVRMRGVFKNDDRLFWPGQFVNVRILLDTITGAVLVPNEAVQIGSSGHFVFVVKADNTVELRPIVLGQRQGDDVVITDGVKAGETVVVTGQLALAPGAHVAVQPDVVAKPSS